MLSGDGNENSQKISVGELAKKQLCTCSTFFCTFRCQRETSRKFLITRFVKEML